MFLGSYLHCKGIIVGFQIINQLPDITRTENNYV